MPIIVSDTSPVRALDHLGQLDLLSDLFETILIPPAVERELLLPRKRFRPITVNEIRGASVRAPSDAPFVRSLGGQLDPGEAEAIALARELDARLLIDERAGRAGARS